MEEVRSKYRFVVLAITFLVNCIAVGFAWMCMPLLLESIGESFPLSGTNEGLLLSSYVIAIAVLVIPAGIFADRFGFRPGISIGALIVAIFGLIRGFSADFMQLFILSLIVGIGMAFIMPNLAKMVGEWFNAEEFGLANGIVLAGMGIGNGLVAILADEWFLPSFGWRGSFQIIGVLGLIVSGLWLALAKERTGEPTQSHHSSNSSFREDFFQLVKVKDLWLLIGIQVCLLGIYVGFLGFLPDILKERGMTEGTGMALACIMFAAIVANVTMPWLSDKIGKRKPFIIIFGFITALFVYIVGTIEGMFIWPSLIILGFALGAYTPLIFVIPLEVKKIGRKLIGTAGGLILCIGNIGGAIFAPIAGYLKETQGSYAPVILLFVIMATFVAILAIPMKETGTKPKD